PPPAPPAPPLAPPPAGSAAHPASAPRSSPHPAGAPHGGSAKTSSYVSPVCAHTDPARSMHPAPSGPLSPWERAGVRATWPPFPPLLHGFPTLPLPFSPLPPALPAHETP